MQIQTIDVRRTSIDNLGVYEEIVQEGLKELWRAEREQRRKKYFLRQRIAGMVLLLITLPSFLWLDGDGIAIMTLIPIAICLIFQREIIKLARTEEKTRKGWW